MCFQIYMAIFGVPNLNFRDIYNLPCRPYQFFLTLQKNACQGTLPQPDCCSPQCPAQYSESAPQSLPFRPPIFEGKKRARIAASSSRLDQRKRNRCASEWRGKKKNGGFRFMHSKKHVLSQKLTCSLQNSGWKTAILWIDPFLGGHVSFAGWHTP